MACYDDGVRRRDRRPGGGWYPGAFWASPMAGWTGWAGAGMWGWPPDAPIGYGRYAHDFLPRRRPPRESPTFGRAGDEAALRYARSRGFVPGPAIEPRLPRASGGYDRYDRDFRGRR